MRWSWPWRPPRTPLGSCFSPVMAHKESANADASAYTVCLQPCKPRRRPSYPCMKAGNAEPYVKSAPSNNRKKCLLTLEVIKSLLYSLISRLNY